MCALAAVPRRRRAVLEERIRFIEPTLPPIEDVMALYGAQYARGLITNSTCVARLEQAVAERLGTAHCVAVSSCTSGLTLILRALGIEGEVILPSFTFFATGHAVLWNGLTPVLADCDADEWTLDPADVERRITERTGAIIGVHLYGNPCAVEALEKIAARHKVPLIFDAAHAFGSRCDGRAIGQFGDAEVFSLSPTKLLVAGEGGLVTTNDAVLARRLRAGRNYGDNGSYDPMLLGQNARMAEFNAALALAGLDIMDAKVARHNEIARRYADVLGGVAGLRLQEVRSGNVSTYKDFSVCVEETEGCRGRNDLSDALMAENIETRKYFDPPLHRQTLFAGFAGDGLENSERISSGILSLPIYHALADETVDTIAEAVAELYRA